MAIGGSLSVGLIGLKAFIIQIQAFISPGLPYFSVIGLPDASLSESRERVKSACQASGFKWPDTRVTVNMSPASMPKRGASHDLAIAAGVLSAAGAIPHDSLEETIVLGEVNLDGTVLPIHGLLPIMLHAKERGIRRLIVPYGNEDESRLVPQMDVTCVRHVGELIELAGGRASYTLGVDRATVSCTVEDTPAFSGLGDMSEVGRPGSCQVGVAGGGGRETPSADDRPAGLGQDDVGLQDAEHHVPAYAGGTARSGVDTLPVRHAAALWHLRYAALRGASPYGVDRVAGGWRIRACDAGGDYARPPRDPVHGRGP